MRRERWPAWAPLASVPDLGIPRIIGHRGAAALAPENTLASIRAAAAAGARMVELDVKLTRDSVPVLMHDASLKRTTDATGLVRMKRLAALREVDAGAWFDERFRGERVPTLDEAVETILGLGLGLNLEIKPCPGREAETATVACRALRRIWPRHSAPPLISSFSRGALAAARDEAPELPRGLLAERLPRDWPVAMQAYGCSTLHLWHEPLDRTRLARLADEGVPVLLYTVNAPDRARALLEWGAVAVITDAPDRLRPLDQ